MVVKEISIVVIIIIIIIIIIYYYTALKHGSFGPLFWT